MREQRSELEGSGDLDGSDSDRPGFREKHGRSMDETWIKPHEMRDTMIHRVSMVCIPDTSVVELW